MEEAEQEPQQEQQQNREEERQRNAERRTAQRLSEALYSAVCADDVLALRQLLAEGADADQFYDDDQNISSKSILHVACGKGRSECVKVLLEAGCLPNIRDKWGQSPLHYCICVQFVETAAILLEHMGDEVTDIINNQDRFGKSPLHTAAESANVEAIQLLLKYGADVNIRNFQGLTPLMVCVEKACSYSKAVSAMQVLIDAGALFNLVDYRSKRSALQRAAVAKNIPAVELLLSVGADIDSLDNTFRTALTNVMWDHVKIREDPLWPMLKAWATASPGSEGILFFPKKLQGVCNIDPDVMTIIVLLTQAGANLDLCVCEYCNPLLTAAFLQAPSLVRFFLDEGANPNVHFLSGVTPLLVAASKRDMEIVKIFLTYNCTMTIKGRVRRRREDFLFDPMDMALNDGNFQLIELFLKAGYPSRLIRQQLESKLKPPSSDQPTSAADLDPALRQWLLDRISSPPSLRELVVYNIRDLIGGSLLKVVPKLPLPSRIQDSILLKDILT